MSTYIIVDLGMEDAPESLHPRSGCRPCHKGSNTHVQINESTSVAMLILKLLQGAMHR